MEAIELMLWDGHWRWAWKLRARKLREFTRHYNRDGTYL